MDILRQTPAGTLVMQARNRDNSSTAWGKEVENGGSKPLDWARGNPHRPHYRTGEPGSIIKDEDRGLMLSESPESLEVPKLCGLCSRRDR